MPKNIAFVLKRIGFLMRPQKVFDSVELLRSFTDLGIVDRKPGDSEHDQIAQQNLSDFIDANSDFWHFFCTYLQKTILHLDYLDLF